MTGPAPAVAIGEVEPELVQRQGIFVDASSGGAGVAIEQRRIVGGQVVQVGRYDRSGRKALRSVSASRCGSATAGK